MKGTRWLAALLALLLMAGACTRGEDSTEAGPSEATSGDGGDTTDDGGSGDTGATDDGDTGDGGEATTDDGGPAGDPTSLEEGGFGDLAAVCHEADDPSALTDSDAGVTADSISIGTFTDKGAEIRPGLNKEMYDAAAAFSKWCNEHGGINGRQIELHDRDAKLFEFEAQITAACEEDFALVGGGNVFDDDPNGVRVGCGLPNIPGFVVTPPARVAELQVQPVPNSVYQLAVGAYRRAAELEPQGVKKFGIMTGDLPATQVVRDQTVEAVEGLGFEVVYNRDYASQGETAWRNFVQEMRDADVKVFEFVGEPTNFAALVRAMDTEGWYPDLILQQTNFYDRNLVREAGDVVGPTIIRGQYYPFELADENKATQDYLDLVNDYVNDGKIAQLGAQGMSAWLLFAVAADACGADLTRDCLLEEAGKVKDWTGGGLHAAQQPGNRSPSPCFVALSIDADGFEYDEEFTQPTDGIYNCDPKNVVELTGDYGVPRPES